MWERGESQRGRGELYATLTGKLLHASKTCCGGQGYRVKVKAHSYPRFFDADTFEPCRKVPRDGAS